MLKILLSFEGRIGRRNFWLVYLINIALLGGFAAVAMGGFVATILDIQAKEAAGLLTEREKLELVTNAARGSMAAMGVFMILLIFCVISQLSAFVKRLHDMNLSGWWVLVQYVPIPLTFILIAIDPALGPVTLFLNLLPLGLLIACGFFPGSRLDNDYGKDRLSIFDLVKDGEEGDWHDRVAKHKQSLRDQSLEARETAADDGPVKTRPRRKSAAQPGGFGRRGTA